MALVALALALATAACAALPGLALYVGMATGILAILAGAEAYRHRDASAAHRLGGAAAGGLGALALALCGIRYALVLAALDRLHALLG